MPFPFGRRAFALALAIGSLLPSARLAAQHATAAKPLPAPPVAAVHTKVDTVAGVEWSDPYAWLRDDQRQQPEVLAYLRSENAYADRMTSRSRTLEDRLFREMVGASKGDRPLRPRAERRVLLLLADGKGPAVSRLLP